MNLDLSLKHWAIKCPYGTENGTSNPLSQCFPERGLHVLDLSEAPWGRGMPCVKYRFPGFIPISTKSESLG